MSRIDRFRAPSSIVRPSKKMKTLLQTVESFGTGFRVFGFEIFRLRLMPPTDENRSSVRVITLQELQNGEVLRAPHIWRRTKLWSRRNSRQKREVVFAAHF